jgi:hypothetical protein
MCRLISAACAVAASLGLCNLAAAATMDQLRKIDFNHNGALDAGGEFRAYLDLEKLTGELDSKKQAKVGYLQSDIALRGNIPFDQLAGQAARAARGYTSAAISSTSRSITRASTRAPPRGRRSATPTIPKTTPTRQRYRLWPHGCSREIHACNGPWAWA